MKNVVLKSLLLLRANAHFIVERMIDAEAFGACRGLFHVSKSSSLVRKHVEDNRSMLYSRQHVYGSPSICERRQISNTHIDLSLGGRGDSLYKCSSINILAMVTVMLIHIVDGAPYWAWMECIRGVGGLDHNPWSVDYWVWGKQILGRKCVHVSWSERFLFFLLTRLNVLAITNAAITVTEIFFKSINCRLQPGNQCTSFW